LVITPLHVDLGAFKSCCYQAHPQPSSPHLARVVLGVLLVAAAQVRFSLHLEHPQRSQLRMQLAQRHQHVLATQRLDLGLQQLGIGRRLGRAAQSRSQ